MTATIKRINEDKQKVGMKESKTQSNAVDAILARYLVEIEINKQRKKLLAQCVVGQCARNRRFPNVSLAHHQNLRESNILSKEIQAGEEFMDTQLVLMSAAGRPVCAFVAGLRGD